MRILKDWFKRYFSDPQVVILALFLGLGFVGIFFFGRMLAPALTAVVLAYLLEGLVAKLQRLRLPRAAAVTTVYLCFLISLILGVVVLAPKLYQQVETFVVDVPSNAAKIQDKLQDLRNTHPHLFVQADDQETLTALQRLEEAAKRQREPQEMTGPSGMLWVTEEVMDDLSRELAPRILAQLAAENPELFRKAPTATNAVEKVSEAIAAPRSDSPDAPPGALDTINPANEDADTIVDPEVLPPEEEVKPEERKLFTGFISEKFIEDITSELSGKLYNLTGDILSISLKAGTVFVVVLIYLILVPLLVLFFLKDKDRIIGWFRNYLPQDSALVGAVWRDVDIQIGNYIRGKFLEILIVWSATYVTFRILDLDYAMLLALLVGLSVLIPYIGATVMVIPIALIAFFQYGTGSDFWWVMGAYGVIQLLDGNVLAPLLLSEVTNLHPVAIIVAVLAFGGLWGFWGVFFAIPLATLVQAVLRAWPNKKRLSELSCDTVDLEPEPS
jgi:predicted PurR-regulated permease PerM